MFVVMIPSINPTETTDRPKRHSRSVSASLFGGLPFRSLPPLRWCLRYYRHKGLGFVFGFIWD